MNAHAFRLTPVDTWFFRDGRPFEMGAMQSDAESLFPPPTRTLVGALRLALARGRGYMPGKQKWGPTIADVLGDGPNDLGKLHFSGPYLVQGKEVLYPLPMHLFGEWIEDRGEKKFRATTLLRPGEREVLTDFGRIRLPEPKTPRGALQSGAGVYVRRSGYEKVLQGELVGESDVVLSDALVAYEDRIGLARDGTKRTALPGHLYRTRHVRLGKDVGLLVTVTGLPDAWVKACPRLVTLGGENRLADVEPTDTPKGLAAPMDRIRESGNVTITLLTPLALSRETMPRAGEVFADWGGVTVVSACLGKPLGLGGWDGDKRQSLPLRPYLPAGSTWFCKANELAKKVLHTRHLACVGAEGGWGFGAVALGHW